MSLRRTPQARVHVAIMDLATRRARALTAGERAHLTTYPGKPLAVRD